jgi:hypothetical protein
MYTQFTSVVDAIANNQLRAQLNNYHQQLATFSVDVDKRSPEEVAAMILRLTSVG